MANAVVLLGSLCSAPHRTALHPALPVRSSRGERRIVSAACWQHVREWLFPPEVNAKVGMTKDSIQVSIAPETA